MLIEPVHIMDDSEHMLRSIRSHVVRLRLLDEAEHFGIHNSLYLSAITMKFIFRRWLAIEDREFNGIFVVSSVSDRRKVPSDMIEARAQVMSDFPAEYAKSNRYDSVSVVIDRCLPFLVVWLGDNWILPFFEESIDFPIQIDDVLLGPL